MKYVECVLDIVAWYTIVWEEIWCYDGPASGKERMWLYWAGEMMVGKRMCFSVLDCGIWTFLRDHQIYSRSQILRYKKKNNDIPIVCFGIRRPQNRCNACVAKIGLYLMNQWWLCHDLKCGMCVGVLSTYYNLVLLNRTSCPWDIYLPFQHVQTLQQFCGPLYNPIGRALMNPTIVHLHM